jgi:hydrogenase maturation protease
VKRVLIAGMGNVFSGDDGAGPYTVRLLESHYDFAEGVELADLGTPGLDLASDLAAFDVVILFDSVNDGRPAGSVTRYRKEEILRNGGELMRMDTHSLALPESLFIAGLAGQVPEDLLLIGITGERFDAGPGLSESVRNAINQAILIALAELDRLRVPYAEKVSPAPPQIWWESPNQ